MKSSSRQRTYAKPIEAKVPSVRQPPKAVGTKDAARDAEPPVADDNLLVQAMHRQGLLQPKLAISPPDDPTEREADEVADAVVQRKEACSCGGTCASCREEEALTVQRKARDAHRDSQMSASPRLMSRLGSGRSLDPTTRGLFESNLNHDFGRTRIHADRVAEQVMRMPDDRIPAVSHGSAAIQRKCAACDIGGQTCPKCAQEKETIQRKSLVDTATPLVQRQMDSPELEEDEFLQAKRESGNEPGVTSQASLRPDAPPGARVATGYEGLVRAVRGGGRPLAESERAFFEPRFGTDFSGVRIHESARADAAARAVGARAYTLGSDIVFRSGAYDSHLLAHELAHVQQQAGSDGAVIQTEPDGKRKKRSKKRPSKKKGSGKKASGKKASPELKPLDLDDSSARGRALESLEIDEWKPVLRKRGYTEFHSKKDGFRGWVKDAFTDRRAGPDLIAIDHTNKRILIGDVTAGPWSQAEIKPGQRRQLPHDIGADKEKQPHFNKTRDYGHQAARNLPPHLEDYEVVVQDRYREATPNVSRELVVKKRGPIPQASPPKGGGPKTEEPAGGRSAKGGRTGAGPVTPDGTQRVGTGLKGKIARGGSMLVRGLKTVGRPLAKTLGVLGPLAEVGVGLITYYSVKAQVAQWKRRLDAMWAVFDAMWDKQSTDTEDTPVVTPYIPARPDRDVPEKADITQSIRVYDITKRRLTAKVMQVSEDALRTFYYPISFSSLTDLDESIYRIAASQFDCQGVRGTGLSGIRQPYEFKDGYADWGNYRKLKKLLQTQLKLVRGYCLLKRLSEGTLRPEEKPPRPDGDRVTVFLGWLVGSQSESLSATCEGPDADGGWTCSVDGDFESLKSATEDENAETLPEYLLEVLLSRVEGGQQTDWVYSIEGMIGNPEHEAPELSIRIEGALPEGACQVSRYPSGSVLAYVLMHYADGCQ